MDHTGCLYWHHSDRDQALLVWKRGAVSHGKKMKKVITDTKGHEDEGVREDEGGVEGSELPGGIFIFS